MAVHVVDVFPFLSRLVISLVRSHCAAAYADHAPTNQPTNQPLSSSRQTDRQTNARHQKSLLRKKHSYVVSRSYRVSTTAILVDRYA